MATIVRKKKKKISPSKEKRITNPNNANQYLLDPRQDLFWEFYATPGGETFGNAYRSAIKAGYKRQTAVTITRQNWFAEKYRRMNLLNKAEKVLKKLLIWKQISL